MPIKITLKGLRKAQKENLRLINALKPKNAPSAATKGMALSAFRYVLKIIHVDTSANKLSQRLNVQDERAEIFVAPGANNPKSNTPPRLYNVYEQARGGDHATYSRTIVEQGQALGRLGIALAVREMK